MRSGAIRAAAPPVGTSSGGRALIQRTQPDAESDAALLARFARLRDEEAFAELMRRHGPMVLGVSTRVLRHPHDAEDALQAVFLTLSARARALRGVRSVAGWLHNVAVRISLNSLKMKRRREDGLRKLQQEHRESDGDETNGLQELLDAELAQLPARYREVLILRDLEGYSRSEAAKKLGLPPGTIDSRLSRARKQLRERLVRRGVTVGSGALAATLAHCATAGNVLPPALIQETFRHAELFLLAGKAITGTPVVTKITSLAHGELNKMFLTKLSTTVGIAALVVALLLGASPASQILGLAPSVRAAQIFHDDFDDGSIADGNPVKWIVPSWIPSGQASVQNGDLVLTPTDVLPSLPGYDTNYSEMDVLADGVNIQDVSLRTRVRGLSPQTGSVPSRIGITARDTLSLEFVTGSFVWAGIGSNGVIALGYALDNVVNGPGTIADIGPRVSTGLNFVAEDVNLQLDVVGNQARFTVWGASQPKPHSPQIVGTLPNSLAKSGTVALFGSPPASDWNQPVAFRHVELIAIPEPSSIALGSLSAVALASFAFRRRLVRFRQPRGIAHG
jgi:RNA polymerase sigma factor (sigma-70 family)